MLRRSTGSTGTHERPPVKRVSTKMGAHSLSTHPCKGQVPPKRQPRRGYNLPDTRLCACVCYVCVCVLVLILACSGGGSGLRAAAVAVSAAARTWRYTQACSLQTTVLTGPMALSAARWDPWSGWGPSGTLPLHLVCEVLPVDRIGIADARVAAWKEGWP